MEIFCLSPLYNLPTLGVFLFNIQETPENIQLFAATIPQAFIQAVNIAVPLKKNNIQTFKVQKSEELRKAEIAAKKAANKWRTNGCPRDEEIQIVLAKKEQKTALGKK